MSSDHDHSDDWGWPVTRLVLVLVLLGALALGGGYVWYRRQLLQVELLQRAAEHRAQQIEKLKAHQAAEEEKAKALEANKGDGARNDP
jgi:cell division protein FtsB